MLMISVWNRKGGVGKTCLSLQLAGMFANNNKTVNVIDLDPQGGSMLFAELAHKYETPLSFHVSRKPVKDCDVYIFDHSPGVDLGGKLAPLVIVPTILDASSYSATLKSIEQLEEEKRSYILIPNRVESSIKEHNVLLEKLEQDAIERAIKGGYYDNDYQMPSVRKRVAYQRGYNYGMTVYSKKKDLKLPAAADACNEIDRIGMEIGNVIKSRVKMMKS